MKTFKIEIPNLPPGLNDTYKPGIRKKGEHKGKPYIYKHPIAKEWEEETQMLVRTESAYLDWEKAFKFYKMRLDVWGSRNDADSYIKLAQDAVTRGLGFDDVHLLSVQAVKRFDGDWKGIIVTVVGLTQKEIDTL